MKYRYDIDDIENLSSEWHTILECTAYKMLDDKMRQREEVEFEFSTLDTCDMRYIDRVFQKHPKMRRLMPSIIKEAMILYWQPSVLIDGEEC